MRRACECLIREASVLLEIKVGELLRVLLKGGRITQARETAKA